MFHEAMGVSETLLVSKQGGEEEHKKNDTSESAPKKTEEEIGTSSKPKKLKKKIGEDDEEEEEDTLTPEQIRQRKLRDKELDELLKLNKKLEEEERKKNSRMTLDDLKVLFPPWDLERMIHEVVEEPKALWLEPAVSFDSSNSPDSQHDFPMTSQALIFRCFEQIKRIPVSDSATTQKLFDFYLKYSKPQYETWSLSKIIGLKVGSPKGTDFFPNVHFKAARGSDKVISEFSLADLPFMNPFDWISMFNILSREMDKYEPLVAHLRRMLVNYMLEISELDCEVAAALKKKPSVEREPDLNFPNKFKFGEIRNKDWSLIYKRLEDGKEVRSWFYIKDKHLYKTDALERIILLVSKCKHNKKEDVQFFSDMLTWYITFRRKVLNLMKSLQVVRHPKQEE